MSENKLEQLKEKQLRRMRIWQGVGIGIGISIVAGLVFAFWQLFSGGWQVVATITPTPTFTLTPVLPTSTVYLSPTPTETLTPTPEPTRAGPTVHVVEAGESLFFLADLYEISVDELIEYNLLEGSEDQDYRDGILNIGDEVLIPPPDFEIELPTNTPIPANLRPGSLIEYVVQPGDLLGFIAEEFNTTVAAILEENDLENPDDIQVGDVLQIPYNLVTLTPITPTATRPPTRTATPAATGSGGGEEPTSEVEATATFPPTRTPTAEATATP